MGMIKKEVMRPVDESAVECDFCGKQEMWSGRLFDLDTYNKAIIMLGWIKFEEINQKAFSRIWGSPPSRDVPVNLPSSVVNIKTFCSRKCLSDWLVNEG